jgi:tetratricopeptide (TPR) repeat protein
MPLCRSILVALICLAVAGRAVADEKQLAAIDAQLTKAADALYEQAYAAYSIGDYVDATARTDAAIAVQPKHARAIGLRGLLRISRSQWAEAKQDAKTAVELAPNDPAVYVLAADTLALIGEPKRAGAAIERALKLDSQHPGARLANAKERFGAGDFRAGLAICDEVLTKEPAHLTALTLRAVGWAGLQDHAEAAKSFAAALAISPNNPVVLARRAEYFYASGEIDKALGDVNAALEAAPRCDDALRARAHILASLGDVRGALVDMDQLVLLTPRHYRAYASRGSMRYLIGEIRLAMADYNRALEFMPGDLDVLSRKSKIQVHRGNVEAAIAEADAALKLQPQSGPLLVHRAGLFWSANRLKDAIQDYTRAIEVSEDDFDILSARAHAYCQNGDEKLALADIARMVELKPEALDAGWYRGNILMDTKNYAAAVEEFSKSPNLESDSGDVLSSRGLAYARLGKAKEALADHDKAVEKFPWSPEAFSRRGTTRAIFKDYAGAAADFRRAIELDGRPMSELVPTPVNANLSPEALAHGTKQLKQMLADRPAMAEFIKEGDALWTWTVRKFAGEDTGFLVDWNSGPVNAFFGAYNARPSSPGGNGYIQLNDIPASEKTQPGERFDRLWSSAVFELHNIIGSPGFAAADDAAVAGTITAAEYASRDEALENLAGERKRNFYATVYLAWAEKNKLPGTLPDRWNCNDWEDHAADRSSNSPWAMHRCFYAAKYDLATAARLADQRRLTEASVVMSDVIDCAAILESETVGHCFWLRGKYLAEANQTERALADYSKAVELHPTFCGARWSRGWFLLELGKKAEAIADFREVQRLTRIELEKNPTDAKELSFMAWSLATLPIDELRHAEDAIKFATLACKLNEWKNYHDVIILAAAHAEGGDFEQAEKHQLRAIELAPADEKEGLQSALELYRSKKPYREQRTLPGN